VYFIGHEDLTDLKSNFSCFFISSRISLIMVHFVYNSLFSCILKTHRCLSLPCRNTRQTMLTTCSRAVRINAANLIISEHPCYP